MSYEEICAQNRLLYEAEEILTRLIAINTALSRDKYLAEQERTEIRMRISANIKLIV